MLVYDGSVWRLVRFRYYSIPQSLLDKTLLEVLVLRLWLNLWYDAYNTPDGTNFDPNIAGTGVGNGRGFDYLNGPSSKRFGASLKLTF